MVRLSTEKRLEYRLERTNNSKKIENMNHSCYNEYEIHIFLFYKNKGGHDGTSV